MKNPPALLKYFFRIIVPALVCLLLIAPLAAAGELTVAVAANFAMPFEKISEVYTAQRGTKINTIVASTGTLYAQIVQGAPFDIFLAADSRRPEKLHESGLALSPFVYARGEVVLWSVKAELTKLKKFSEVIQAPGNTTVAIANPGTAPYGTMAMQALKSLHIYPVIQDNLVFGQNVGQVFQYAQSRVADSGFVARSQALSDMGRSGKCWRIPKAALIIQKACIIRKGNVAEAQRFSEYLGSPAVRPILAMYGYQ